MALSRNEDKRNEQIARRLKNPTFGLGFWAAVDATKDPAVKAAAQAQARKAFPYQHGNWAGSRHHFSYEIKRHVRELVRDIRNRNTAKPVAA